MGTMVNAALVPLAFDAKTTEEYVENADITDNPVEGGAIVTDHRQERPLVLTVEGVISESPFVDATYGFAVDNVPGATTQSGAAGNRGYAALSYFRAARTDKVTWISSRFGIVENLLIESIKTSVPATASTKFSITLKQVQFAESTQVSVPREFVPKPSSEPIKQCTKQATNDVTSVVNGDEKAASVLFNANASTGSGFVPSFRNAFGIFGGGQ